MLSYDECQKFNKNVFSECSLDIAWYGKKGIYLIENPLLPLVAEIILLENQSDNIYSKQSYFYQVNILNFNVSGPVLSHEFEYNTNDMSPEEILKYNEKIAFDIENFMNGFYQVEQWKTPLEVQISSMPRVQIQS